MLPGQIPAHEARCAAVGKRCHVQADLSDQHLPHPAPDAGDGHHQLQGVGDRAQQHLDPLVDLRDRRLQEVDVAQHLGNEQAVVFEAEAVGQRLAQCGDLRAQPALGQLGQGRRILVSLQQRFQDRPAGLPQDRRSNRGELNTSVLEHLLQALDRAGCAPR